MKVAVTFLNGYNGIFNVVNKNNKFIIISVFEGAEYKVISKTARAYELENLNEEIKRIFMEEGYITEEDYPFAIKPNFSTMKSNIEIEPGRGWQISFVQDDTLRDRLGFEPKMKHDDYNLSDYPVDILHFDKIFLETDVAQGLISKGTKSGINHNFMMDVDPGYKSLETFRGGVQWYMKVRKDFISNASFELKNKTDGLVSFKGHSITFRLSFKEIYFFQMPKTITIPRIFSNKKEIKTKPDLNIAKSNLRQNLQSLRQKLLSGGRFVEYK